MLRPEQSIFRTWYGRAREEIRGSKSTADQKAAVIRLYAHLDDLFVKEMIQTRSAIACSAGCAFCCYLRVDVNPLEAFILADHIRGNFVELERVGVRERAEANRLKILPMTLKQHFGANLPCPMLRDNRCTVYDVRPATCRRFHSVSVEPCKESFDNPDDMNSPSGQIPKLAAVLAWAGMAVWRVFEERGFDMRPYDVNPALVEALRDGAAEVRWGEKKKAFSESALAKDHWISAKKRPLAELLGEG